MSTDSKPSARVEEPAAAKQSYDIEMDDIDGHQVKGWFREEFQDSRKVAVRAAISSSTGKIETSAQLDLAAILKGTEARWTTKLSPTNPWNRISGQIRLREKAFRAHLDFGNFAFPRQILNPYLAVTLPVNSGLTESGFSGSLGAVYYFKDSQRDVRHIFEVAWAAEKVGSAKKLPLIITQNLSLRQKHFTLGLRDRIVFSDSLDHESRVVVSKEAAKWSGYAHLGINRLMQPGDLGFGVSWRPRPGLALLVNTYREFGRSLLDENKSRCPVTKASLFLKDHNLSAGLQFDHAETGLGLKLGYFHRDRLALALSTSRGGRFRGSLLLDQQLSGDAPSFGWGARLEFDC